MLGCAKHGRHRKARCIGCKTQQPRGGGIDGPDAAGAVEVAPRKGAPGARAFDLFLKCFENGLLMRQTGETVALSPPLIIDTDQIGQIVDIIGAALKQID